MVRALTRFFSPVYFTLFVQAVSQAAVVPLNRMHTHQDKQTTLLSGRQAQPHCTALRSSDLCRRMCAAPSCLCALVALPLALLRLSSVPSLARWTVTRCAATFAHLSLSLVAMASPPLACACTRACLRGLFNSYTRWSCLTGSPFSPLPLTPLLLLFCCDRLFSLFQYSRHSRCARPARRRRSERRRRRS